MNDILTPSNAAKAMGVALFLHGAIHAVGYSAAHPLSKLNTCIAVRVLIDHSLLHFGQFSPSTTALKYGVPSNEDGIYNRWVRGIGAAQLFTSAIVCCLIFRDDVDRFTAYAVATLVFDVRFLFALLAREASRHGETERPYMVNGVVSALMTYGFLNEEWAPWVAKFGVGNLLFQGLAYTFPTKFMLLKIFKIDKKRLDDPKDGPYLCLVVRALGIALTQAGVFGGALEYGVEPVYAFGLSCAVLALGLYFLPLENANAAKISFTARHFAMATGCALMSLLMLEGFGVTTETVTETSTTD